MVPGTAERLRPPLSCRSSPLGYDEPDGSWMTGYLSQTESDLTGRLQESQVFERCDACGHAVVQLSTHRCPTGPSSPTTRAERERRERRDDRDGAELVGVYRRSNGNSYAYHELDDDGEPCCPTRNPPKAKKFELIPRREAQAQGKSPCGHCPNARR